MGDEGRSGPSSLVTELTGRIFERHRQLLGDRAETDAILDRARRAIDRIGETAAGETTLDAMQVIGDDAVFLGAVGIELAARAVYQEDRLYREGGPTP